MHQGSSSACAGGGCCADFWKDLANPLPSGVRLVSIYSKSDGLVDWTACLDPHADELVEIGGSHCGMAVNPVVWRAVATALESLSGAASRRAPEPEAAQWLDVAA